ncbi:hypothetical protein IAR50_006802 [Cryptococcus sp. DSM 104548]
MLASATPRAILLTLDRSAALTMLGGQLGTRCSARYAARRLSTPAESGVLRKSCTRRITRPTSLLGKQGLIRFISTGKPENKDKPPASATPTSSTPLSPEAQKDLYESPYTIPNALTLARLLACPLLGYEIVQGDYALATGILFASGVTDWLDGWLARRYNSFSVLGSILDPAADKALMTTLVGTLAYAGLLPIPLAILIVGRDVGLSISAFYFRYISLPPPRTLQRYFDFSIPSAQVTPTQISKINTLLQLVLMGVTTVSPLLSVDITLPLQALQWAVAGTTIWSGLSYVGRSGVKILGQTAKKL